MGIVFVAKTPIACCDSAEAFVEEILFREAFVRVGTAGVVETSDFCRASSFSALMICTRMSSRLRMIFSMVSFRPGQALQVVLSAAQNFFE